MRLTGFLAPDHWFLESWLLRSSEPRRARPGGAGGPWRSGWSTTHQDTTNSSGPVKLEDWRLHRRRLWNGSNGKCDEIVEEFVFKRISFQNQFRSKSGFFGFVYGFMWLPVLACEPLQGGLSSDAGLRRSRIGFSELQITGNLNYLNIWVGLPIAREISSNSVILFLQNQSPRIYS